MGVRLDQARLGIPLYRHDRSGTSVVEENHHFSRRLSRGDMMARFGP